MQVLRFPMQTPSNDGFFRANEGSGCVLSSSSWARCIAAGSACSCWYRPYRLTDLRASLRGGKEGGSAAREGSSGWAGPAHRVLPRRLPSVLEGSPDGVVPAGDVPAQQDLCQVVLAEDGVGFVLRVPHPVQTCQVHHALEVLALTAGGGAGQWGAGTTARQLRL